MGLRQDTAGEERDQTRATLAQLSETRKQRATDARDHEYERLRDELVVGHLRLVRFLAAKFVNRGEPLDDLIQVGTVGLIKAIDRYDLDRGVEFTTYATPTIVGEIKRYFRDKGWALKVPRRLQELNAAVVRAVERLSIERGRSPLVGELAEHLGASVEEIVEAQELSHAYNLASLDADIGSDDDPRSATISDRIGANDSELELLEDRANLERAMLALNGRERAVVYWRFFESLSQTEIAKRLHCSQMHVSRLQAKALEKLRTVLKE